MAVWMIQLLVGAFLAVLFLQSGLDKITDRRGNSEWLESHFAGSPLAEFVPLLLTTITVVEVTAGGLSALGTVILFFGGGPALAFIGAVLSAVAIVMLFLGQRLAKDYEGAAVLVPYFLVSLVAIHFLG